MQRLLCALLVVPGMLSAQAGGVIAGVVRNAWSKTPLKHSAVTLSTTGAEPLEAVTYTDENGGFGFTGVPAGSYFLCARFKAYQDSCYGAHGMGQLPSSLTLTAGQHRQEIVLPMLPLGSVTGTVTDSDGDPVSNAEVDMLRPVYERRTLHWDQFASANTNDRGEYRLPFVVPGQYRFLAVKRFQPINRIQPDVTNGQKQDDEQYGVQFYPNATDVASASTLSLSAGNDIKSIDFTLSAAPRAMVSGNVAGAADNEAPVMLMLLPVDEGLANQQLSASAGAPDFRFQFPFVPAGQYRLVAIQQTRDHFYRSVQSVEAGPGSENIAITLTQGKPLKGQLALEGKGAKEQGPYKIQLIAGDGLPQMQGPPTADVDENGNFTFKEVPAGLWDIGVQPLPPGSYVKAMLLGNKDVLTDDMYLTDSDREPMKIVLSMDGAIVSGTAFDKPGAKHTGRLWVLLAPDGKYEGVLSFYELTQSDDNGHFEFQSVTPGRYKIYAFDHMDPDEYWNPDFLKPYEKIGEAFEAGEGARLQHDTMVIIRGPEGAE